MSKGTTEKKKKKLVGFTCSCERKGGGAFSGAHKVVVNTQHKDKFSGETNLVGFTCSCERKGGGAFSGAHKVVVNTQHKDKFSGETNLVGFTYSWERTSAQHKERGLVRPPTLLFSRGYRVVV